MQDKQELRNRRAERINQLSAYAQYKDYEELIKDEILKKLTPANAKTLESAHKTINEMLGMMEALNLVKKEQDHFNTVRNKKQ
jgi:hypothetical protein